MAAAIYGLVGVLLGSVTTVVLTVYRERQQREQDRQDRQNAFQSQSLLALQDAVSDLIKALFNEQDRMLKEMQRTGEWPVRQWETPTATGWSDAELRLQASSARVFDIELRDLARQIHTTAKDSVWASDLDKQRKRKFLSNGNSTVSTI